VLIAAALALLATTTNLVLGQPSLQDRDFRFLFSFHSNYLTISGRKLGNRIACMFGTIQQQRSVVWPAMVLVQIQNAVSGNVLGQCDADTLPELKAWIFTCLKIPASRHLLSNFKLT
jgi:hypothetical protein